MTNTTTSNPNCLSSDQSSRIKAASDNGGIITGNFTELTCNQMVNLVERGFFQLTKYDVENAVYTLTDRGQEAATLIA
jgi:hypothetical protein